MKKRLMAVLLCVCMAAVLLTPYASVLTADGALRLGVAGADGSLTEGGDDAVLTEGGESGKATDSAPTTVQSAPQEEQPAPQQEQSEPQAEGAPQTEGEAKQPEETKAEQPAQTEKAPESEGEAKQPEETKAEQPAQTEKPAEKPALPKYVWDSEKDVVWKDGSEKLALKDYVVKANWTALAYTDPTDRSEAKTYAAGERVRVCDEIRYEDRDGIERKWSVVLDGSDFYFVLSEALESAPELPAQAPAQTPAQTDMKSLFGGDNVNPANIINPNTAVRTYVFMYNGKEISRQSVKDGDTLKPVEVPVGANERFEKWVIKDTETEVKFGEVSGVDKTENVTVTAVVKTVYTVYFEIETADGKLVLDTRQGTSDDTISNFETVDVSKYQLAANQSVIGWKNENNETVTSVTIENKDITLTAVIGNGYWITFDSNDGSYVAPVFKATGETLDLATIVPTRTGYKFDGWYNNATFTGDKVTVVSDTATLHAKWIAQNADLTVVFWYENANDDEYSYKDSKKVTELAGREVGSGDYSSQPFSGRDDSHFTINTDKVETVTVEGDGSSKLNVYFKRNQYTLTFTDGSTKLICEKEEHKHRIWCYNLKGKLTCKKEEHTHTQSCYESGVLKTITAKYQADIHSNFPIKDGDDTIWWTVPRCDSFKEGTRLGSIDRMPGENITFTKYDTQSGATLWYYVETLNGEKGDYSHDGKQFKLYKKITTNTVGYLTYTEEFHDIAGFTQWWSDPAFSKMGKGGTTDYIKTDNYLCYTRNSYTLKFFNYNAELDKQASVQYEALLKDHLITPDYPDGLEQGLYTFEGWYFDQYFKNKVEDTSTMPAADVMLYANWVPKTFIVTVYDDAKKTTLLDTKNIPLGNKISEEEMPKVTGPDGSEFLGWVNMDDHKPFNFDTEIRKDYNLYALVGSKDGYTVTYDKNYDGEGTAPSDPNKYAAGTQATVLDKGGLTHPDGKFFLGWATTSTATTADYQPGGTMPIAAEMADKETREITLYAVWGAKPATTTLTYKANYDGANPAEKKHEMEDGTTNPPNNTTNLPNNAEVTLYTAKQAGFNREGYKLIGWAKTANATERDYKPGDKVIVDTINQATANILYAVWEQSTTTVTVTKVVEGPMGDKTRAFEFEYSLDNGETWRNLKEAGLKHGDSATIEGVAIGSTLLIREEKVTNYRVAAGSSVQQQDISVTDGTNGYTITVLSVAASETITVTNTNTLVPDTGVILDSLPYVLILAVVALGAAGVVIRRRRSREDD